MKFTWFNLMPWPDLPDDFRQTNRSVWVDIPSRLFDPVTANRVYNEYMDQLEYADSLGFDGIGCNEHHQNGYGIMPSPNIIAAGLARRTSQAAICVIGNSIALYNPPIRRSSNRANGLIRRSAACATSCASRRCCCATAWRGPMPPITSSSS